MKEQVKTNNEGYLANPLEKENQAFGKWSHNFSDVPDFRFPDLFNYLVDKDPGYNAEGLKSYKSLWDTSCTLMHTKKTCFIIRHNLVSAVTVIFCLL